MPAESPGPAGRRGICYHGRRPTSFGPRGGGRRRGRHHRERVALAKTRVEKDSMGEMEVPVEAYYGAQTERARRNFRISPLRFPRSFIRALGLIKKAAAQVNMDLGLLPAELGQRVVQAAQAVADGQHDDQFVVDIFQTGSGTSSNMNTNEVIAGIANESFNNGVRGGQVPGA